MATCLALGLIAPTTDALAGTPVQQAAFAGGTSAFFGYSVAIDGDTALVGAFNDNGGNGAAYVFTRTGTSWTLQTTLTASTHGATDGASGDQFGYTVALKGDLALVGAAGKASGQGYVYAFSRSGTAWGLQTELTSSDGAAGDCFGCSLGVSGTTAVIGAPDRLGTTGAAYVYSTGLSWQKQQELLGSASGDYFGYAVGISPDETTVAVGAFGATVSSKSQAGSTYVFARGASWAQPPSQTLITAGTDAQANDAFGCSVSVANGQILVGAYNKGAGQGAAYVFSGSGASWSQQAKLTAADGTGSSGTNPGDYFGFSVGVSGSTAIVGAYEKAGATGPGAAYVFTDTAGTWSQDKIAPPLASTYFGYSVAASGSTVLVGAFGLSSDSGAAYVYVPSATTAAPAPLAGRGHVALLTGLLAALGAAVSRRKRGGGRET